MRRSTLALTAVGISAAAVAGSAFTASNTMPTTQVYAGYGDVTVSGVTVTHISYNQLASDATKIGTIVFTIDTPALPATPLSDGTQMSKMTLKDNSDVLIGYYACSIGPDVSGSQEITCDTATPDTGGSANDVNPDFGSIKTVGLTVTDKS